MSAELLPCPFCGSEAKLTPGARGYRASVECTREDCQTGNPEFSDVNDPGHDSAKEAVESWNRRAPAAQAISEQGADPLIGGCIDGGACHHACVQSDGCFRKRCCVPLSISGLGDDWKPKGSVPAPMPEPAEPMPYMSPAEQRAAGESMYAIFEASRPDIRATASAEPTDPKLPGFDQAAWERGYQDGINAATPAAVPRAEPADPFPPVDLAAPADATARIDRLEDVVRGLLP